MKLEGFIDGAYELDSVNVESQRCVNMYVEAIESGRGKGGQDRYLRPTPGLDSILEIGDGPIRMVYTDSINRLLVVSGDTLYRASIRSEWKIKFYTPNLGYEDFDILNAFIDDTDDNFETSSGAIDQLYDGMKVRVTSAGSLPSGLAIDTDYWIIIEDATHFQLAASYSDAIAGTAIDLTDTGSGTITFYLQGQQLNPRAEVVFASSIDFGSDQFTLVDHGLEHGLRVRVSTNATPLPSPLDFVTDYFVIRIDADNFKLATSPANVDAGTAVDLIDVSGDWKAEPFKLSELLTFSQTSIGNATLSSSSGVVKAASMSLAGDGTDSTTMFTDGSSRYRLYTDFSIYTDGEENFNEISSGGDLYVVETATSHVAWIDGYFIFNASGTNRFYVSRLNSTIVDELSFASAEGDPDLLVGLATVKRNLYLFGEKTIEVYYNTGNADFPFERVEGGFIEFGLQAKYSLAKLGGNLFWLGRDAFGEGIIYVMSGSTPERISTHGIEQAISGYANPENAVAYTYQMNGHGFYVICFDEMTWVYDLATRKWHERAYTNNGVLEKHRAQYHAYHSPSRGHVVGDYANNKLYLYDESVYTDDGDAITRLRTCPHISSNLRRVFYHRFQLDMEVGIGLDGGVQGSDPTVMLDFSNDGGHTYSSESWALADAGSGQIGDYKKRVNWRKLGSARDRVFRVKITDPVKVRLIDAFIDFTVGRS